MAQKERKKMTENTETTFDITKHPDMPAIMAAKFFEKRIKDMLDKNAKPLISLNVPAGASMPVTVEIAGDTYTLGKIGVSGTAYDFRIDKRNKAADGKTDDERLAEWCATNRPELVEMKPVLKPGAAEEILSEVKARGKAITEEGELIPGVRWSGGAGGAVRITPDKNFEQVLRMVAEDGNLRYLTGSLLGIEQG